MQMNDVSFGSATPVDGYGPGFFRIGGQPLDGALCIAISGARSWGGLEDEAALFDLVADVDVLFVGTGPELAPLPKALRARLEAAGVGVEVMSTPSACRTYNVLLGEGRRVALAVLPV